VAFWFESGTPDSGITKAPTITSATALRETGNIIAVDSAILRKLATGCPERMLIGSGIAEGVISKGL
jgi:hypothetical protein